jgi:ribonucleoside-diphosphate reductase alpha chain
MKTEIKNTMVDSLISVGKDMMSESKFFMGYSRWLDGKGCYETWNESVERVMTMHREKYADKTTADLKVMMLKAENAYKSQQILGAQRALQFGGAQMRSHNARMYNCSASHADRPAFFQEAMYLLLCGCGVGFSVQKHHIAKLPGIASRSDRQVKAFQIPDSVEGWADAFGVLLSSYFETDGTFPEYKGAMVHFDYSKVRAKGALISGGFKAPGPDPLRAALVKCEALIEKALAAGDTRLRSIVAYDFVMHMSDAVLAGGVRRSATLCMFSKDDTEMLSAKTGNWFVDNPQRGRSNNSVVLQRDELTRDEWAHIMKSVRDFGEPGFIFVDNKEFTYNPCVEIGMLPVSEDGVSGFQFCNLAEINGGQCDSREKFLQACEAAAIMCTLQAGYTDFKYVAAATRQITERESLIGVSITGWMNNPKILFDADLQREGAELIKRVNREVAALIGINPAARTTCAKPSGNASVLLGTASGIHGEHAPRYFRNVQMSKEDDVAKLIEAVNPKMVEQSVWSAAGTDLVVSFPVVTNAGSIYKSDLMGVKQLQYVKIAQQNWVEAGTNENICVDKRLRHNISNTISVDDWDEVEQYIFDNRESFAGISLLSSYGDKGYVQAPFTEVHTAEKILEMYGEASMFASGLIVEGLHAFNNNLWSACDTAMGFGQKLDEENASDLLKRDWVRRFNKFAGSFFAGDLTKTSFCLKDCFNLHKWVGIEKTMKVIDFSAALAPRDYVDVNTLGSQACVGSACELTF